MEAYIIALLLC